MTDSVSIFSEDAQSHSGINKLFKNEGTDSTVLLSQLVEVQSTTIRIKILNSL